MTERKLATIQIISELHLIECADKIEYAKVMGWQVVVKKSEFVIGDLCIFCEIDSLMPEKPEFEFLRAKKFRVKSIKLRGQISQGLVLPLSVLGEQVSAGIKRDCVSGKSNPIGLDVSKMIGVIKYEPPTPPGSGGVALGDFPSFLIPKTDEIRIQSAIKVIEEIRGKDVYLAEKEDGTSFTGYHWKFKKSGETEEQHYYGVCSRNRELKDEGSDVYWKISHKYNIENKLKQYYELHGINLAVQGEICGGIIQSNPLRLKQDQLFLFNIYNIDEHKYLDYAAFKLAAQELDLPTVRILGECKFNFTLEELLEIAKGKYPGTNNNREGIVIRPVNEAYSETLAGRMSFKVINNDYLLKDEK